MTITAIICEYNPFHNGHYYLIQQAKKITGADYIIALMSGDYVQRGEPAVFSKYNRTAAALSCGIDLVLELPSSYAGASAERFAQGAICSLNQLGCIDYLCFGSEAGELPLLREIADYLCEEPAPYSQILKTLLRQGYSFPLARSKAMTEVTGNPKLATILSSPNNILSIEYLKAIKKTDSSITPVTIPRTGDHYHQADTQTTLCSATALRNLLQELSRQDRCYLSEIQPYIPRTSLSAHGQDREPLYPLFCDDFSLPLRLRLLEETRLSLLSYEGITETIANRIDNQKDSFETWRQFCHLLHTKESTYASISRCLLHILLCSKKTDERPPFMRVLGIKKDSSKILSFTITQAQIPLLSRLSDAPDILNHQALLWLQHEIHISNLYETIRADKYHLPFVDERKKPLIKQ